MVNILFWIDMISGMWHLSVFGLQVNTRFKLSLAIDYQHGSLTPLFNSGTISFVSAIHEYRKIEISVNNHIRSTIFRPLFKTGII